MATPIPSNRARFTLAELQAATGGRLIVPPGVDAEQLSCEGVAIDSRAVSAGSLFVAVRGGAQDGARFLPNALSQGAAALLVHEGAEAPEQLPRVEVADTTRALGDLASFHRQRWGGEVVAITGSAGKTTTKELTAGALLGLGRRVLKTTGNLNNQFGVPMTLFGLGPEHDTAVLELGTSGVGEIARLGEIARPDVAVVLIAALAHTAGIGTLDAIADEKASLWRALGSRGTAIVNLDDAELARRTRKDVQTITFGSVAGAQVRFLGAKLTPTGTHAKIAVSGVGELELDLRMFGQAAAFDACAAIACALSLRGESDLRGAVARAVVGLSQVAPTAGRMAPFPTASGVLVIDDSYNANPSSVMLALESLATLAREGGGRAVAVLGDMKELGDFSQQEHARAGELAVRLGLDLFVGCGSEMAHATSSAARLAGGRLAVHPTRIAHVLEPLDAVPIVQSLCRKGDVVLVKGSRSMQMERVVAALIERCGGAA